MVRRTQKFEKKEKLPRLYKISSQIIEKLEGREGSLKNLIAEAKHPNTSGIYALVLKVLHHRKELDQILRESSLLQLHPATPIAVVKVLLTELLWGKGRLGGENYTVRLVRKFHAEAKKILNESCSVEEPSKFPAVWRWARMNTLLASASTILHRLRAAGWVESFYEKASYADFIDHVKELQETEFAQDYHVKDLLVFHPDSKLHLEPLVEKRLLFLQDKASTIPPILLNPEPGSVVLDACAAPGLKTLHLVSLLAGQGSLVAIDRDTTRAETLRELVSKSTSNPDLVEVRVQDFLALDPESKSDPAAQAEYIMLDPSCSGSGIARREHHLLDEKPDATRLWDLSAFQFRALLHALSFPRVKRVVYSTCSIHVQENEAVVRDVLQKVGAQSEDQWKIELVPAWPEEWAHGRGQEGLEECIRACPEQDLCNGFFVAVLEKTRCGQRTGKTSGEVDEEALPSEAGERGSKKKKKGVVEESKSPEDQGNARRKKKKKKVKPSDEPSEEAPDQKKEKKEKREKEVQNVSNEKEEPSKLESDEEDKQRRKKKKRKRHNFPSVEVEQQKDEDENTAESFKAKPESQKNKKIETAPVLEDETIKNGKKKKRKRKSNQEEAEESMIMEDGEFAEESVKRKKKKRDWVSY